MFQAREQFSEGNSLIDETCNYCEKILVDGLLLYETSTFFRHMHAPI